MYVFYWINALKELGFEFYKVKKIKTIMIKGGAVVNISKFFKGIGSVSRNVSEKVSCPVLIVR